MREIRCLRCAVEMQHIRRAQFQLGQTGWILGDLPNLLAGAMELDVYSCPQCGKVELFQPEEEQQSGDRMAQTQCLRCGRWHDLDDPYCPFCKTPTKNQMARMG